MTASTWATAAVADAFLSSGNDDDRAFLDSPLGKALQLALADMTKKMAGRNR
jgi:hypothetical protein